MLGVVSSSWLGKLPTELIDIIPGGNGGMTSRAEAEAGRLVVRSRFLAFRTRRGY